jgi:toxin ParE1/3/4
MPIWAPEAIADLQEAWVYIARDNEGVADRIIDRIGAAADRLDRHPLMGRGGKAPDSREFTVSGTRYFLVYYVRSEDVEIARVVHSARDWPPKG